MYINDYSAYSQSPTKEKFKIHFFSHRCIFPSLFYCLLCKTRWNIISLILTSHKCINYYCFTDYCSFTLNSYNYRASHSLSQVIPFNSSVCCVPQFHIALSHHYNTPCVCTLASSKEIWYKSILHSAER